MWRGVGWEFRRTALVCCGLWLCLCSCAVILAEVLCLTLHPCLCDRFQTFDQSCSRSYTDGMAPYNRKKSGLRMPSVNRSHHLIGGTCPIRGLESNTVQALEWTTTADTRSPAQALRCLGVLVSISSCSYDLSHPAQLCHSGER